MKVALFAHAGLGNTLMLVPLMKRLKAEGASITLLVTSPWDSEQLFHESPLIEEIVPLKQSREHVAFGISHRRKFDLALLDFFAATRKNIVLAKMLAPKVVTNHWPPKGMPAFARQGVVVYDPVAGIHEATQNLRLIDRNSQDADLTAADFAFPGNPMALNDLYNPAPMEAAERLHQPYIALQACGGNNSAPYKNWSADRWTELGPQIAKRWSTVPIVLLGDNSEQETGNLLAHAIGPTAINLVGKTAVDEAIAIISSARVYLGVDSGLMHIAAALATPTLTIWGGSDYRHFGYHRIAPQKHRQVHHRLDCWPCNRWLKPNTSKTADPSACPDFACLKAVSVDEVFAAFEALVADLELLE